MVTLKNQKSVVKQTKDFLPKLVIVLGVFLPRGGFQLVIFFNNVVKEEREIVGLFVERGLGKRAERVDLLEREIDLVFLLGI